MFFCVFGFFYQFDLIKNFPLIFLGLVLFYWFFLLSLFFFFFTLLQTDNQISRIYYLSTVPSCSISAFGYFFSWFHF